MEHFKVEHFERERQGERFPKFETLGPNELLRIRKGLARKIGLDESVSPLVLIKSLLDGSHPVEDVDATSESFQLSSLAEELDIILPRYVDINWDRLATVDRMEFAELSKYFHDIWYPSADDIEVFDDTLSWILFVHHSGSVRVALFGLSRLSKENKSSSV